MFAESSGDTRSRPLCRETSNLSIYNLIYGNLIFREIFMIYLKLVSPSFSKDRH